MLGYLPGVESAEADRLAAVGGEANAQPFGGQPVNLPADGTNTTFVWSWIEAQRPEIPWLQLSTPGVYLFVDRQGRAVENAEAYLYCGLESEEAQRLAIRFCGHEPIRVWFNGEEIPLKGNLGNRCEWYLTPQPLDCNKGLNHLLIRLQNRKADEFLSARLTAETGGAPTNVHVVLPESADTPLIRSRLLAQDWDELVAEIPSVPPSADADFFGTGLGRTMNLLETGAQTRRPVRILFYGQSITCQEWVWMLVRRLRERYPGTDIQAENWALSGWQIPRLVRTIKHDILCKQPDLVIMHAYGGRPWEWERILQALRRDTTADIMLRSSHIRRDQETRQPIPEDNTESRFLRRLARKYGCEFVEGRKEWLQFMRTHEMTGQDFRADGVHLNRPGCVLMAQLFERHFRPNPAAHPWFDVVRRYEAVRPLADHRDDEVRLDGDGWQAHRDGYLVSDGADDSLRLRFTGTRLDLVMPPHTGRARVLIDGRPLSAWNVFMAGRPGKRGAAPAHLLTYYTGTNMVAEGWNLKLTHLSGDRRHFRYTLIGSVTGPDGEGDSDRRFVSNSGRITIEPGDFAFERKAERQKHGYTKGETDPVPVSGEAGWRWSIGRPYDDIVSGIPLQRGENPGHRFSLPYRYVTIVDGLPPGEHELELQPLPPERPFGSFALEAIEAHRPPLTR